MKISDKTLIESRKSQVVEAPPLADEMVIDHKDDHLEVEYKGYVIVQSHHTEHIWVQAKSNGMLLTWSDSFPSARNYIDRLVEKHAVKAEVTTEAERIHRAGSMDEQQWLEAWGMD